MIMIMITTDDIHGSLQASNIPLAGALPPPLTIEGNALQITTNNSWESLAIGRNPLLMSRLSKEIPYYRKKPLTMLSCGRIAPTGRRFAWT